MKKNPETAQSLATELKELSKLATKAGCSLQDLLMLRQTKSLERIAQSLNSIAMDGIEVQGSVTTYASDL